MRCACLFLAKGLTVEFDGDGVQDLAILNQPLQELQIYHSNGDGTFVLTQRFSSMFGHALAAADFNGDGVQDLATLEDRITVYLGNPAGGMIKAGSMEGCQHATATSTAMARRTFSSIANRRPGFCSTLATAAFRRAPR